MEPKIDERARVEIQKVFAAGSGIERVFSPQKSGQIPDRAALTLIILPPDQSLSEGKKPVITGADGQYQWDVLNGSYRVHVEASGDYPADSIIVSVPPPVTYLHVGLTRMPNTTEIRGDVNSNGKLDTVEMPL